MLHQALGLALLAKVRADRRLLVVANHVVGQRRGLRGPIAVLVTGKVR